MRTLLRRVQELRVAHAQVIAVEVEARIAMAARERLAPDGEELARQRIALAMVEKIRANWNAQAEVAGDAVIKFTIQRDGTITAPEREKSSGYTALDINALRAVVGARQLPPLPAAFPNPTLTVHLNFQYTR